MNIAACLSVYIAMSTSTLLSANTKVNTFIDNDDGTVTDAATGLIWQQQDDDTVRNYFTAITYCRNLNLTGMNDWRVPHVKELISTVDYRIDTTTSDIRMFPDTNNAGYWTVTGQARNVGNAWVIDFSSGQVVSTNKDSQRFVRCVRKRQ